MALTHTCTRGGHAAEPFPWGVHRDSCSSRVRPCCDVLQAQHNKELRSSKIRYETTTTQTATHRCQRSRKWAAAAAVVGVSPCCKTATITHAAAESETFKSISPFWTRLYLHTQSAPPTRQVSRVKNSKKARHALQQPLISVMPELHTRLE
jgi:hypothetical protein